MPVGVEPIDASTAVVVVDFAFLGAGRISPVGQSLRADAPEDVVELCFGDEERVVLLGDVIVRRVVVERDAVGQPDA